MSKSDNLQTKLRKLYSCQDTIPKLIEGEEKIAGKKVTEQSLSEYYVKLQMIVDKAAGEEEKVAAYDKVVGEKRAIEVVDIFNKIDDQHSAVGKILLLGAAGVGKTTLLHYMSYYWGKGRWDKNDHKVFDDKFEYLFRVRLKTLLNENWSKDYSREEKKENLLACFIHRCLEQQISDLELIKKINKDEVKITLKEILVFQALTLFLYPCCTPHF
ncbi:MAG: hypothetical protein DMENIID0002_13730 [Rickettsia endosymbiont of Sergentomyia squamirostris]|uniref:Uncharacterized protein n=1 Tax=Candidatus Tisiphia endosymbiont of Sergentomyia squamirostris TaxID=3113639 RepID=A0AAT9GAD1_9RICK